MINFVFGLGPKAGEAIVKHPRVPIVSFTGGTVTAVKLRQAAAPFSKKLSLEVSFESYLETIWINGSLRSRENLHTVRHLFLAVIFIWGYWQ